MQEARNGERMSKLRDRLTNPKDIGRYDRNYNSCETIMTQAKLDEELAKARNDVLDKIRAEIKKESEIKTLQLHWGEAMGLKKAIDIIDKHISELRDDADVFDK